MKRSNKPIFWSLFGAGGMLAALVGPMLVLITGLLIPLGLLLPTGTMSYDRMCAFAQNAFGKAALVVVISPGLSFEHDKQPKRRMSVTRCMGRILRASIGLCAVASCLLGPSERSSTSRAEAMTTEAEHRTAAAAVRTAATADRTPT